MDAEIFLIVVVPAIVIIAVLYAVVSEMRHNSVRRNRWDLHANVRSGHTGDATGRELVDTGRE
jgi:hypothetical protein